MRYLLVCLLITLAFGPCVVAAHGADNSNPFSQVADDIDWPGYYAGKDANGQPVTLSLHKSNGALVGMIDYEGSSFPIECRLMGSRAAGTFGNGFDCEVQILPNSMGCVFKTGGISMTLQKVVYSFDGIFFNKERRIAIQVTPSDDGSFTVVARVNGVTSPAATFTLLGRELSGELAFVGGAQIPVSLLHNSSPDVRSATMTAGDLKFDLTKGISYQQLAQEIDSAVIGWFSMKELERDTSTSRLNVKWLSTRVTVRDGKWVATGKWKVTESRRGKVEVRYSAEFVQTFDLDDLRVNVIRGFPDPDQTGFEIQDPFEVQVPKSGLRNREAFSVEDMSGLPAVLFRGSHNTSGNPVFTVTGEAKGSSWSFEENRRIEPTWKPVDLEGLKKIGHYPSIPVLFIYPEDYDRIESLVDSIGKMSYGDAAP